MLANVGEGVEGGRTDAPIVVVEALDKARSQIANAVEADPVGRGSADFRAVADQHGDEQIVLVSRRRGGKGLDELGE